MRRPALALALVVALGLGGCGGRHTIPRSRLSGLVLQEGDLSRPFSAFFVGRQAKLDATSAYRADPGRFGREDGWIARFRRAGSRRTAGPLVVVSRADLFKASGGAKKDLAAYAFELARVPGTRLRALRPPRIGDATIGETFVQPAPNPVRFVVIAWRYRNASASINAEGFDGQLTVADAVALARRQQRRIASG